MGSPYQEQEYIKQHDIQNRPGPGHTAEAKKRCSFLHKYVDKSPSAINLSHGIRLNSRSILSFRWVYRIRIVLYPHSDEPMTIRESVEIMATRMTSGCGICVCVGNVYSFERS